MFGLYSEQLKDHMWGSHGKLSQPELDAIGALGNLGGNVSPPASFCSCAVVI